MRAGGPLEIAHRSIRCAEEARGGQLSTLFIHIAHMSSDQQVTAIAHFQQ